MSTPNTDNDLNPDVDSLGFASFEDAPRPPAPEITPRLANATPFTTQGVSTLEDMAVLSPEQVKGEIENLTYDYCKLTAAQLAKHLRAAARSMLIVCQQEDQRLVGPYLMAFRLLAGERNDEVVPKRLTSDFGGNPLRGPRTPLLTEAQAEELERNEVTEMLLLANERRQHQESRKAARNLQNQIPTKAIEALKELMEHFKPVKVTKPKLTTWKLAKKSPKRKKPSRK
jgi:hypothetical protein